MRIDELNSEQRKEEKYILDKKEFYDEFVECIENYLNKYSPVQGTKYTINTSIYFDSPELSSLKDHLNGNKERSKMRLRTYANNGIIVNDRYLEIKSKESGITKKDRLKIGKESYRSVLTQSILPINEELIVLNEDHLSETDTLIRARTFNSVMEEFDFKPVIQIDYKRIAYQNDETFRITLDQDLKITPLSNLNVNALKEKELKKQLSKIEEKFLNFEDFILEVKRQGKEPKWLKRKLDKYIFESTNFSKYLYSMSKILGNELKVKQK